MSSAPKQIEFLSRAIVNRLEDRGLVEFVDAEAAIQIVARTLGDNFQTYEAIEQEARARFARHSNREPSEVELTDEIRRVAVERNFLL